MKVTEIRPYTTYIGHGGEQREVKSVQMDVSGDLSVSWKGMKAARGSSGSMPIKDFARWAVTIQQTLSEDLKHYLNGR